MENSSHTKRTFFYERTETNGQTVYRFKRQWWKFYIAWGAAALLLATVFFHLLSAFVLLGCTTAALGYFIFSILSHIKPNAELRAAAQRGALKEEKGFVFTIDKTKTGN